MKALEVINKQREAEKIKLGRIFILTDGQDHMAYQICDTARDLTDYIRVHTIGIGTGCDTKLCS
jgi:hypothetical protein